jgi:TRAP-type mannitol/chloroaromatic compound transport system substrate-binding protein
MMALYDVRNPIALQEEIIDNPDITILPFPDDVMAASEEASFEIFDESAAASADFASIFEEWKKFRTSIQAWHGLAEASYLEYVGRA